MWYFRETTSSPHQKNRPFIASNGCGYKGSLIYLPSPQVLDLIRFIGVSLKNVLLNVVLKIKNPLIIKGLGVNFADWTGLEPATSAVTGRHSNQLNYQSVS